MQTRHSEKGQTFLRGRRHAVAPQRGRAEAQAERWPGPGFGLAAGLVFLATLGARPIWRAALSKSLP